VLSFFKAAPHKKKVVKKSTLSADEFFTKSTVEQAQEAMKRSVDEKKNRFDHKFLEPASGEAMNYAR